MFSEGSIKARIDDLPPEKSRRFKEVVNFGTLGDSPEAVKRMYEICVERGCKLSFKDFLKKAEKTPGSSAYQNGFIEEQDINQLDTFGVHEPTMLELLGAEDIRALRDSADPSFLLLGSKREYSAEEFFKFANKIKPGSSVHVVDNDFNQKKYMEGRFKEGPIDFQYADATKMPFADESQDVVASNSLLIGLRILEKERNVAVQDGSDKSFRALFQEVFRVLKPGGVYIMSDIPDQFLKGIWPTRKDFEIYIEKLAKEVGFELAKKMDSYHFPLRADVSSATIDDNGNPQYENLVSHEAVGLGLKFVKPKTKEE